MAKPVQNYTAEQKRQVKQLYLRRCRVAEIEQITGVSKRSIWLWAREGHWREAFEGQTMIQAAEQRYLTLISRENKTEMEIRELGLILKQIEILERRERLQKQEEAAVKAGHHPQPGADQQQPGQPRKKRSNKNNDLSDQSFDEIRDLFKAGLFDYQLDLWEHKSERIRNILKSRQIGLTWYFAREAFTDALLSGDNQIFLSASRAQADVFREYICSFARDWFGVELKGKDKIELHGPAGTCTLYFLSTNSATAQSYHGHVYIDEYFWIPKFEKLNKVASAMAAHKKWRKTYFSTPSAKSHDAYPFWSGDIYQERHRRAGRKLEAFPSIAELRKAGVRCQDGQWRKAISVTDAAAAGCDLFDIEQLKLEYSEAEFQQLFMCGFIDDSASVFRLSQLEPCQVDSSTWKDIDYDKSPPYSGPVWIGYDPARLHDGGVLAIIAPPTRIMGKHRVIEKIVMRSVAWPDQARIIEELCKTYTVDYIGIDRTGPGDGVFSMVQQFFPRAVGLYYTLEKKVSLVLKAQQLVKDKRLLWDAQHSDITAGFMQIKRAVTGGSGQITYTCDRNEKTGHADAAWAIMHAIINEGLLEPDGQSTASVTFSE